MLQYHGIDCTHITGDYLATISGVRSKSAWILLGAMGLNNSIKREFISLYCNGRIWQNFRSANFPRFRDLNHFNNIMNISFSDGSKLEDISKVCTRTLFKRPHFETSLEDSFVYCSWYSWSSFMSRRSSRQTGRPAEESWQLPRWMILLTRTLLSNNHSENSSLENCMWTN